MPVASPQLETTVETATETQLAPLYRVTVIDWPGHGWSGGDANLPGVVRYGELLRGLIDHLGPGWPSFFLAGLGPPHRR
jgi:pimeloyl-ACP methyl ester carboxylesterase